MLGSLKLPLPLFKFYTVYGGPYRSKPEGVCGVRVAAEIHAPAEVVVPIRDFSIPPKGSMDRGVIEAVRMILSGQPVYVGCMGGKGRTGLFLAVLAKAWGVNKPVEYVRANYYPHAVETKEQYQFVDCYRVPVEATDMVRKERLISLFRFRRSLTEEMHIQRDSPQFP